MRGDVHGAVTITSRALATAPTRSTAWAGAAAARAKARASKWRAALGYTRAIGARVSGGQQGLCGGASPKGVTHVSRGQLACEMEL